MALKLLKWVILDIKLTNSYCMGIIHQKRFVLKIGVVSFCTIFFMLASQKYSILALRKMKKIVFTKTWKLTWQCCLSWQYTPCFQKWTHYHKNIFS
jgi:hypothetical protein